MNLDLVRMDIELNFGSQQLIALIPSLLSILFFAGVYWLYQRYGDRSGQAPSRLNRQLKSIAIVVFALVCTIVLLPLEDSTKGQLLSLIGIVLSASLALSSTTFVGNALAGIMLVRIKNFKAGDYIKVGEFEGRISDRSLLHLEIQTQDRNLTILPNLYLVTNPYRIIHATGTIVSVDVSLGYDVNRRQVETALKKAAENANLDSPFVHITGLGDFSINYRIAGVLKEVKQRMTVQAELYKMVLDSLHQEQIEIVSPSFMNQRKVDEQVFIPPSFVGEDETALESIENIVFDKALEAEGIEAMRKRLSKIKDGQAYLRKLEKTATDSERRNHYQTRLERLVALEDEARKQIELAEEKKSQER